MSVFKRGNKWQYDFWVDGKRYRGAIPEARVKAQAERAEVTIRDSVYEGIYGKSVDAAEVLPLFLGGGRIISRNLQKLRLTILRCKL